MLRSIRKKEMIEVCGTVQYRTQYARSFCARCSREEYAAKMALSTGIDEKALAKTAVAMVKAMGKEDDVIAELEKIIQGLKEEKDVQ